MMRMYGKILNGMLVCLMLLLVLTVPTHAFEESTIISVYPSASYAEVGSTFNVNVTVSNVYDLVGWEFKLYYLSAKLNGTSVAEGPFLKRGGDTFFYVVNFTDSYNATHGLIWLTCALLGAVPGVNGNGTLAIVTFKAKEPGSSSLMLKDTLLSDSRANPIAHTVVHGTAYILTHDIALAKVSPSKTVVGQGLTAKIDVMLRNEGNFTETLNITVYASMIAIGAIAATVANGSTATVTLTWYTTGFAKGNYTINAFAWPVKGEIDTIDNKLTDGWIIVAMIGDITGPDGWPDGKVDMRDVAKVARLFGVSSYDPKYEPNCDIYYDGKIDMKDVAAVAKNFGKIDP